MVTPEDLQPRPGLVTLDDVPVRIRMTGVGGSFPCDWVLGDELRVRLVDEINERLRTRGVGPDVRDLAHRVEALEEGHRHRSDDCK